MGHRGTKHTLLFIQSTNLTECRVFDLAPEWPRFARSHTLHVALGQRRPILGIFHIWSALLLKATWVVSDFLPLRVRLLWTFLPLSFGESCLCLHSRVDLLNHRVCHQSDLVNTVKSSSKNVPDYTPVSDTCGFQLPHILARMSYCLSLRAIHSCGGTAKTNNFVVFLCISLVTT